jgi:hypothetical protein
MEYFGFWDLKINSDSSGFDGNPHLKNDSKN